MSQILIRVISFIINKLKQNIEAHQTLFNELQAIWYYQKYFEIANRLKYLKYIPACLCIFSPKTPGLATHAYNLYNNRSKNPVEPLFLSNPTKKEKWESKLKSYIRLTKTKQVK